MQNIREKLAASRSGSVAVEAAIVIPLFVVLMMGVIDFGRLFYTQMVVQQAAIESARAVSLGQTNTQATDVANSVMLGVTPFAHPTAIARASTVTVATPCPALGTTAAGASSLTQVNVSMNFEWLTPLNIITAGSESALPQTVTAHGKAVCRR